jgi:hypothetical protein
MLKYAPDQTVSIGLLFVSVQLKHRSETIETKVLFLIVPKLVSVSVLVFFQSKLVSKYTLVCKKGHSRIWPKGHVIIPGALLA